MRYEDDIVRIAESKDDLQRIVNTINKGSHKYGLKINIEKTKTMIVSKSNNRSYFKIVSLKINGKSVEQVRSFVYLGACITDDGRNKEELNRRAGRAKTQFMTLKNLLSNSK